MARVTVQTKLSDDELEWLDLLGVRLHTTNRSETLRQLVRYNASTPPRVAPKPRKEVRDAA